MPEARGRPLPLRADLLVSARAPESDPEDPKGQRIRLLEKILARERALRSRTEQLLEDKTRNLYLATQELALRRAQEHELAIARHIQSSLLPANVEVRGMSVAGRMLPAQETGGDFYDVWPTRNGCWLGIGDVTGHGLSTGLVTLMIQSAVAAYATVGDDFSPSDVVVLLNRVLYANIRERLHHDDHVTLSLLRYFDNGQVLFAGAHEEIVHYRAGAGMIETLPTPGPWLGALRDVGRFAQDQELKLDPGDVMLLYTDGVTEARDIDGRMYGLERLCDALGRSAAQTPLEICDAVMTDVQKWAPVRVDDVTVVACRYAGNA